MELLIVIGIGLLGGFFGGLLGVGGGVIFVPLLMLLKNFNIHKAIGTSLLAIVFIAVFGAFFHHKAGMVDIKTAIFLGCFSILGVWLGSQLSVSMDATILRRVFAICLVVVAVKLFWVK